MTRVDHAFLDKLFDELFPILRSITGPGLHQSLEIVSRHMPLTILTVPGGTRVFDWTVPPEWHLRSARLTHESGRVIADVADSNLHVLNYATPVDIRLSREELDPHLHSLPDVPEAIPYATSYYKPAWGFCLKDSVRRALPPGLYHAKIDSAFVDGVLPIGESVLEGETKSEILLSSYLCHPSLGNNELSGPLSLLGVYQRLKSWPRRRYTYRFVLNPETIGSLCYLHLRADHLRKYLAAGTILNCLGGPNPQLTYKVSKRGDSLLDRVMLSRADRGAALIRPFDPTEGSDERQYCSAGFNFPMGQTARTYGEPPYYHTSLDDKAYMSIASVVKSVDDIESVLRTVEIAGTFRNLSPYGEPQLGKRGLYPTMNVGGISADGEIDARTMVDRILTLLSYSDGTMPVHEIARKHGLVTEDFRAALERLEEGSLLRLEPRPNA